ncbi:MAG: cadmium-translocating P-type ATPase, partial [Synergistaceae bacterium]|nr:cadmium-translocating P-type ATPase [Synergistaceae bacterium]
MSNNVMIIVYILVYIAAGYSVILEALRGIRDGEIFGECLLMTAATVGALILGEYAEACAVMIFYRLGEFFADYASEKTRKSVSSLMNLRPDYANLENQGRVDPSQVPEGSVIIVKPGEKIPIDGVVVDGRSGIDTSALTGESMPSEVMAGSEVLSGSVNLSGVLKVKTTRTFSQSTASKILELIETAGKTKSSSEKFITRFAKIYIPSVFAMALIIAIVPAIFTGNIKTWAYRALVFLSVSCPCALVVSVPLAFFAALGASSRRGILVKGGIFIERLAEVSTVIFDKTGTLTKGVFEVSGIFPEKRSADDVIHMAAHAERFSPHPAAEALRRAYPNESDSCRVDDNEEIAGFGVRAKVNGHTVVAGSSRLMNVATPQARGTVVHVSVDGEYSGHVVISDKVKENAGAVIKSLKSEGIERVIMLTGDSESSAKEIAGSIGISEYYAGLLPSDTVKKLEEIDGVRAFVGDGINDAPVLSCADVGG